MTNKELIVKIKHIGVEEMRLAIEKIEKELKAFEMLKEKMTIETDCYDSDDISERFEYIAYNGDALNIETQEEFDLLKEVLENE